MDKFAHILRVTRVVACQCEQPGRWDFSSQTPSAPEAPSKHAKPDQATDEACILYIMVIVLQPAESDVVIRAASTSDEGVASSCPPSPPLTGQHVSHTTNGRDRDDPQCRGDD